MQINNKLFQGANQKFSKSHNDCEQNITTLKYFVCIADDLNFVHLKFLSACGITI
jgi:hypothetical protein